ncbi:DUF6090 family protein [Flammeovirgaceae bacterium SG7u.111]|nr:DUF6090 family protein [Flammeovirgaceae bacterium SG7u.132]WPO36871.1 DUF6090 family protein [Flammeovirgaceae bacterium SG7u.111]
MLKKLNWKYAVGEVLIVIIGLTIAFSLNRWNENRKDATLEREYLQNMLIDLENEATELGENRSQYERYTALAQQIIQHTSAQLPRRDTVVFKVFEIAKAIDFLHQNTTYQTLVNSGDFKLIKDFTLRRKVEEHYALYAFVDQEYSRQHKIHEKYLADFFIYKMDYAEMGKGDFNFFDDKVFSNIIRSLHGTYGIAIKATDQLMESNNELAKNWKGICEWGRAMHCVEF